MSVYLYMFCNLSFVFFFSSRRRHTRWPRDWSSDVCSSDLSINISGVNFTVVGTFNSRATGDNAADEEETIYIPNRTLRHTFNQTGWIGNITVIPQPGVHAAVVEEKVKNLIHEHHRVHPEDLGVFSGLNMQNAYDRVQGLFTGIAAFSWVVAEHHHGRRHRRG